MPKKVLIALPAAMLEQVDYIAKAEHRTRSDLMREALRRYLEAFRRTQGVQNFAPIQELPPVVPPATIAPLSANAGPEQTVYKQGW